MKDFMNEFYQIHGFNQSEVDYEKDLDLEELQNTYIIEF
jgi:trans-2-enoyl-CoA reductase